jgi:hypothetical protein
MTARYGITSVKYKDRKVHKVLREFKVRRAVKEFKEFKEFRDQTEYRVF